MARAQDLRGIDVSTHVTYTKAADERMGTASYTIMIRGVPTITPYAMASIKEMVEGTSMAGSTGAKARRTLPPHAAHGPPIPHDPV